MQERLIKAENFILYLDEALSKFDVTIKIISKEELVLLSSNEPIRTSGIMINSIPTANYVGLTIHPNTSKWNDGELSSIKLNRDLIRISRIEEKEIY